MTDQTKWGIPEVQLKNKIQKYPDDNFKMSLSHADKLTVINLSHLIHKLEKLKEEKYERENEERIKVQI
jgi:hypothetical protein